MAYSDAVVTEALVRLAVNKYNYELTAEQMGVTVRSLRNWEKSFPKKSVPALLERAIERMLMVIPETWTGHDWAITIGILMDKWLLIQGEPTERTESLVKHFDSLSDGEKQAVVAEAERIIASFSAGDNNQGIDGGD